jgi:hypothetical protein
VCKELLPLTMNMVLRSQPFRMLALPSLCCSMPAAASTACISSCCDNQHSRSPLPLCGAGRAGYGWVLFDLASGRLAARGCMSLRYRHTAGQAEFEGLLAGLRAALEARVASLAVQVRRPGGGIGCLGGKAFPASWDILYCSIEATMCCFMKWHMVVIKILHATSSSMLPACVCFLHYCICVFAWS